MHLDTGLYPKTDRAKRSQEVVITEKLDGSNLGFFNDNGKLVIAQRNRVYSYEEINKSFCYRGLLGWLEDHHEELLNSLHPGSGIFGEWLGMGKIGYGSSELDKKFYYFAKARLEWTPHNTPFVTHLNNDPDLLHYAFVEQECPDFIAPVPRVAEIGLTNTTVSIKYLDNLYKDYCEKVGRRVEGFVVYYRFANKIVKYVRCKNGKPSPHKERG